jgi:hypothetical protein
MRSNGRTPAPFIKLEKYASFFLRLSSPLEEVAARRNTQAGNEDVSGVDRSSINGAVKSADDTANAN